MREGRRIGARTVGPRFSENVNDRRLFTADWFGVREKHYSQLEIYDRLRASEHTAPRWEPATGTGLEVGIIGIGTSRSRVSDGIGGGLRCAPVVVPSSHQSVFS